MAEGFAKASGKIEAFSAGSKPSGEIDLNAVAVMKEERIDISNQKSKGFSDLPYQEFDYVITMGCKDVCPFHPSKEKIDWEIEDPKGKPIEEFRKARDKIEEKVKEFIAKS
jgi:arsenate reductase